MKTAISYFFIFISLNTFASTTTQDFTGKYELISGDQDCAQNLRLSSYFDDELTVDNLETSNLLLGFSSINEGVTSKTYGQLGHKICYKNTIEGNKLIKYQSEEISIFRPCLLTKLNAVHSLEINADKLLTHIYQKNCQYQKL